jgi:lipopolysaccharide export system ATP-binding protein|tara:strand:+ start:731 stop:1714 length:984 start_codon:yes stop_codon:yes gene_type:complete
MKKKILIRGVIDSDLSFSKENEKQELKNKSYLLKKDYVVKGFSKNNQDKNLKPAEATFLLKKRFKIVENSNSTKNIFSLNSNKSGFLKIQEISKSLGGRPILKNVSLSLEPGSIVGLLGPNGSGKTTLFNIIIGKIFPDSGNIFLKNEKIQNLQIHKRSLKGISLLEQHKGLFGNMTAEENLYAILELHLKNKEDINEKIDSLLNYFDLSYLKKTKANLLSGGEYKKVSILQRICNPNISILLLDEPCAALDPLSINSLKKFIVELKKIGLSILITDHNYWAIENILDKAYVIKDGKILVEGTTEEISQDENAIKYYLGGGFGSSRF